MKKKGFTLIELLGVIILLGVLALVVFPLLLKQINNAKKGIKTATDVLILEAAQDYVNDKTNEFIKQEGNSYCVSIEELIKENYFNPDIKDQENNKINSGRVIEIKYQKNEFKYKLVEASECQNIDVEMSNEYPEIIDENPGIICGDTQEEDYDNIEICHIRSIEDLIAFSNIVNSGKNFQGKTVILENDLNVKYIGSYATKDQIEVGEMVTKLTSGNGFTPIGNSSTINFAGTFDGNDKKLGGLYISNTNLDNAGLFGYTSNAVIKDFTLDSYIVRGKNNIGGLVGYNNNSELKGNNFTRGNVYGNHYVGGIAGYNTGKITSSTIKVDVDGNDEVGLVVGANFNITESVLVEGNLTGTETTGGIAGYNIGSVKGLLLNGTIKCINCTAYRGIGINHKTNGSAILAVNTVTTNGSIPTSNTSLTDLNGYTIENFILDDINAYERVIDTRIGGDNDQDGYYLDYDDVKNIKFVKIEDKPINFTLEGEGTEENPYLIVTAEDLIQVSLNKTAHYKLMANISFENETFYTLGSGNLNEFEGVFDGNGYSITNISYKSGVSGGLFAYNKGTIKNLNIQGINASGMKNIGSIVGYNEGTIINVTDKNSIINGRDNYTGFVGRTISGLIQDVEISNLNVSNQKGYAGGITGYVDTNATIKGIKVNSVNVISNNNYVGGIAGENNGVVTSAFVNNANVEGKDYVGLAIGNTYGTATSLIVSGNVIGNEDVGGISGYSSTKHTGIITSGSITCAKKCGRVTNTSTISNKYLLANRNVTVNGNIKNEIGSLDSQLGLSVEEHWFNDINLYESAVDTRIGGDNDQDGYYLEYKGNTIDFIKISENPIEFTLAGSGTSEDPYQIKTAQELYQVSLNPTSHYILINDIDLKDTTNYLLSSSENKFTGVFNGNKKTISNFKVYGNTNVGLFGVANNALIYDLFISDIEVEGSTNVGGLIGTSQNASIVKGITTNNSNAVGYQSISAMIGYNDASLTSSIVNGSAKGDYISKSRIGLAAGSNAKTLNDVIVSGDVEGTGYTAGIIGYNNTKTTATGVYLYGNLKGTIRASGYQQMQALVNSNIEHPNKDSINSAEFHTSNAYISEGYDVDKHLFEDINAFEALMDTRIGGDNNQDGYYLDYDENNNIVFIKTEEKPIVFTLSGSGTEEDPYQIRTPEELYQVSLNLKAHYKLENDIDLAGTKQYMLSGYKNIFEGVFDGNNYTIKNLDIKGSYETGLFGRTSSATIKNLKIDNFNTENMQYLGSLIGFRQYGLVEFIEGNNLNSKGKNHIAGLIGINHDANSNIYTQHIRLKNLDVTASNSYAGGIAGNNSNNNIINIVKIEGENSIKGNKYVGGIVGYNDYSRVTNVIVKGNVSGTSLVGGLFGELYRSENCTGVFTGGEITGSSFTGRVAGYTPYSTIKAVANYDTLVNGNKVHDTNRASGNGANATTEQLKSINAYEYAIDTYIGDDNDQDGYYLDYTESNEFDFVKKYENEATLTGSGTAEDPYLIYTIEDMKLASKNQNAYYKLMNDLDYTDKDFYQIGSYDNKFVGNFNGNNKTISNLQALGSNYIGFIGYNNGTIIETYFNNIVVSGWDYAGPISYNKGTIKAVTIDTEYVDGYNNVGGIIGYNDNPISSIIVKNDNTKSGEYNVIGNDNVGGIIGYNYNANVKTLVFSGNVSGASNVGGIIGRQISGEITAINKGGEILSTRNSYYFRAIGNASSNPRLAILANKDIIVNGTTRTSEYITSAEGRDATEEQLKDINTYEYVVDTYIGGDNDQDGYYLDYNESNEIVIVKVIEEEPLTGAGTQEDPYLIYTAADLKKASKNQSAHYKLMSDIDLKNNNFYTLGSYQNKFTGNFEGNGFTISNLNMNANDYSGFIGYNEGKIENTKFNNINIGGENNTGLIGYNNGEIKAITVDTVYITGNDNVGGIVGQNTKQISSIILKNDNTESGVYNITGKENVGGIIGYSYYSNSKTLVFSGNVSGVSNVGGIVGLKISGEISAVNTKGEVLATGNYYYRAIGNPSSNPTANILSNKDITVNGVTRSSRYTTSTEGRDATEEQLRDINTYDYVVDTYIGGDNDQDGYYLDYNESNEIVIVKAIEEEPLTGTGTQEDPYLIYTAADLKKASKNQSAHYKLMSDIDLINDNFYTLGSFQNKFTGSFDGNGFTISNLSMIANDYSGFIGYNEGKIENTKFSNINIAGENNTGLIGYNYGEIKAITADTVYITGNDNVGGIVGQNTKQISSIILKNDNTESGVYNITGKENVGGIIGYSYYSNSKTLVFSGNVSGVSNVGGIVGLKISGEISAVNTKGEVLATGNYYYRAIGNPSSNPIANILSNKDITVNGTTRTSEYITSTEGRDATEEQLRDINTYDYVVDTYIGGDNDQDGYYLDYNEANEIAIVKAIEEEPLTGSGTQEDPYLIYTAADLKKASKNQSAHYKLMSDIDLINDNFYTLGSVQNKFTGSFNGNHFTISNLSMIANDYSGFISYNEGIIQNTNFSNININGENNTGLIGYNNGEIKAITVDTEYVKGNNNVGGIVGYNAKSISSIILKNDNTESGVYNVIGKENVGGIIGYNHNATGKTLVFSGNVSGVSNVAGINGNQTSGEITGVYTKGEIIATGGYFYRGVGYAGGGTSRSIIVNKDVIVNGTTRTSEYTNNWDGKDATEEQLKTSTPYIEVGFNFTNTDPTTEEYIWYFENEILKFKNN